MKQIVDKLNKIAKKINENVELSDRDLIIDSLDSITKAYGGTPNDSTLIVDKLDDIYNNIGSAPTGNIEITENGENINVAPYATATVNVSGGSSDFTTAEVTITNNKNVDISSPELAIILTDDDIYQTGWYLAANSSHTYTFLLYKGQVELTSVTDANNTSFTGNDVSSTTGSVENLSDEYELYIVISGDGSITFG